MNSLINKTSKVTAIASFIALFTIYFAYISEEFETLNAHPVRVFAITAILAVIATASGVTNLNTNIKK